MRFSRQPGLILRTLSIYFLLLTAGVTDTVPGVVVRWLAEQTLPFEQCRLYDGGIQMVTTNFTSSLLWRLLSYYSPLGEPGSADQNIFSPQKGFITDRNTPQFHQLSGWLVSDDLAGEEARYGGPGLAWLHAV